MNGLKVLMMPLGMGSEAEARLSGGLLVAKRLGAHFRVLHLSISPQTIIPEEVFVMSHKALGDLYSAFDQHVGSDTQRAKKLFLSVCNKHSVPVVDDLAHPGPSASWLELQGLRSGLVARYGKAADLVVMARPPEGRPTATFEAAILETGRPLLLIPRVLKEFPLDTVTVAWNCTPEASRSLAHAMPLLREAKRAVVISTDRIAGQEPGPKAICDYLAAHGITATAEILQIQNLDKGQALLEKAREHGSNLVVMGAYSKKRIRESVFGGVTHYMLAHADIPFFLSH